MKRQESHYSFPHAALSAALLYSLVACHNSNSLDVVMKEFFMQISFSCLTWEIALIINGLATALMLMHHLVKMLWFLSFRPL